MTPDEQARLDEFTALSLADQVAAIEALAAQLAEAGGRADDLPAAIARAGIELRATACVVLSRGTITSQTPKLVRLPPDQHAHTFALLLAWLAIS